MMFFFLLTFQQCGLRWTWIRFNNISYDWTMITQLHLIYIRLDVYTVIDINQ